MQRLARRLPIFSRADTILDVEITPNRGDLLSHFGLAREIAALTEKKLKSTARESKIPVKKTGVTITSTRGMSVFLRAQDRQRYGRTESAVAAREDRERRHSLHQQYRRHLQFCNAGAWPTYACIRR